MKEVTYNQISEAITKLEVSNKNTSIELDRIEQKMKEIKTIFEKIEQ